MFHDWTDDIWRLVFYEHVLELQFINLLFMCNLGVWNDQQWPDNWTAVTQDGKLSAQFEHTLLVTDTGVDILTRRLKEDGKPYFMCGR